MGVGGERRQLVVLSPSSAAPRLLQSSSRRFSADKTRDSNGSARYGVCGFTEWLEH